MVDLNYSASVEPEGLPGRAYPRLPEEANPQAAGSAVGHGIENAADVLQNVQDKVQQQARVSQLTDAHNQAQALSISLTHDPNTGALTKQGKDAFGLTNQYLPQFDQGVAKIADGIADPRAKQVFAGTVAQMRNQLTEQLDTHELTQHQQFAQSTATASISLAQQAMAANYNHPDIIASNRDTMDFQIDQLAQQKGLPVDSPQVQELRQQKHLEAYQGVITNMITDHKPLLAKTFLDSLPPTEINPAQRKVAELAIQKGQVEDSANTIVDSFRQNGPRIGALALQGLDKADMPDEVKNQIRTSVDRGIDQWHAEQRNVHGDAIMALEAKLGSGQSTSSDVGSVYALHNSGALTAEQAGNMIGRIQKAALDKIPDTTYRDYVTGAVNRGQSLDPTDHDLRKGMADAFTDATQGMPAGSPGWINRGADMARRTGIVPDPMVAWSRTQLVNGEPGSAALGAQTLSRLMDADPRGLPYALKDDKETASMAKMINDAVTAGADPKAAVETARNIINMPDAQKQALEESYKKNKVAASSLSSLTSLFQAQDAYRTGMVFHSIPVIPPAMLGQYEQLRQDYYKTTGGNVQQANQLAQANLKNVWGISEVNGQREFMMYAPEAQNVGLSTDTVQKAMQTFASGHTDDPTKVRLTPSTETATTGGQQWNVSAPDKFGAYGPLLDEHNNPLIFKLPTATQGLKSKATADILDKMASEQNQQKLDNEGNAWLHQGLLKEQMDEDKLKNENPMGEEQLQGRRLGY